MPNYFAHLLFGARVLKALPPEAAEPIRAQRESFNLGCLGPDPLFFYRPIRANPVRREGMEMHKESARPVLERLVRAVRNGVPQAEGYAAGFLCHFSLDAACHPYVNARAAEGTLAHLAIEAELDRRLIERRGLASKGRAYLPAIWDEAVFRAASAAYLEAGPEEVRRGYASMRKDTLLFAKGYGNLAGRVADRVIRSIPATQELKGVILRDQPAPGSEVCCRELLALLQEQVAGTAERLLEFRDCVRLGGRLPGWCDQDFNGVAHPRDHT